VEVVPQATADAEAAVRRDGHVAPVEQRVHVRAEQEPVVDAVLPRRGDGPDVRCVLDRQASPVIAQRRS
jgi:hypothetical protein